MRKSRVEKPGDNVSGSNREDDVYGGDQDTGAHRDYLGHGLFSGALRDRILGSRKKVKENT